MVTKFDAAAYNFRNKFPYINKDLLRWFPGHMNKGLKQMQQKLKSVDLVIEVHDARIPFTGRNPIFTQTITSAKPHILVLNKKDLTINSLIPKISHQLKVEQGIENVVFTNSKDQGCRGLKTLKPLLVDLIKGSNRYNRSEELDYNIMIIGVPNVGKSSLINMLRSNNLSLKHSLPVGAVAGVTRSVMTKMRINNNPKIFMFDTPGILEPTVTDIEMGLKLALCASLQDHLVGEEAIADYLLYWLNKHSNFKYVDFMGLEEPCDDINKVGIIEGVLPTSKRKRELSFAILTETATSRPTSPRSLPADVRTDRVSPFRGRGFREDTSRHTTPGTSAVNSRSSSPPRRRTNSLSRIDKMAQTATLPISIHTLSRPHSPRNFVRQNIEDIRELSELNRERHEAAAEKKRREEEAAILKEMGLLEKKEGVKSVTVSRTTSRSNSPNKITLRSRSNSPAAILHFENIPTRSKELVNAEDGMTKPTTHRSRVRSTSKSQPQSNDGSPKNSKIPRRQASVSPPRTVTRRSVSYTRKNSEGSLNSNRFISNSTSSIHETIKIGSQVHDKRFSKSTQNLSISPAHIKGKPPISPGRSGPPPSNKAINPKRLSPIVGTPNKSPVEDLKPSPKTTTKTSAAAKKPVKTNVTPATSRINTRQPGKSVSRDPSPEKRKAISKTPGNKPSTKPLQNKANSTKPVARTQSTRTTVPPSQRPPVRNKSDIKKPINRTNSMKSLTRIPSSKNLTEKPPLKRKDSHIDLKERAQSTSKINEVGTKKIDDKKNTKPIPKSGVKKEESQKKKEEPKKEKVKTVDSATEGEQVQKQDNETQYDKITNEKGELVILTKKNIISMTTAAITAQPLEVVTKVTNQLPAAFEKARERGVFERHGSKDSLAPKENIKDQNNDLKINETKKEDTNVKDKIEIVEIKTKDNAPEEAIKIEVADSKHKTDQKESNETQEQVDDPDKLEDKKHSKQKNHETKTLFIEDNFKLRPLQPPYNNPEVEKVRQKIDNILRSPEISPTNILAPLIKETTNPFKTFANKAKNDAKKAKNDAAKKIIEVKDEIVKQNEKANAEIRKEATKIVDSIITPVEHPVEVKPKEELKKTIEPVITVVNEKKTNGLKEIEKTTETLVKGEPETEVQSSNLSTPGLDVKKVDGNASDNSTHSNGGFPQSTSTTPKPPPRQKNLTKEDNPETNKSESEDKQKKPNLCQRIIGKCKSRCCGCCVKRKDGESETREAKMEEGKGGVMNKLNCFKKGEVKDVEKAVEKTSVEFESETRVQHKRSLRDMCACCARGRRVSDAAQAGAGPAAAGCCGRRPRLQRRDSILSDTQDTPLCNNRLGAWFRGVFRRGDDSASRRTSMFSKNKSLSPTLPPEDTRPRLDTSLVEHTSVIRGAIPVLPAPLAYFCLLCNIIVPGLGTIFSGMFCLCFGIPRFGVHDGARQRIGSFVINLLVGCGQLFTVLFCLVGWGWSIWWGVIMVRTSRKYKKLKAEAVVDEAEAPPVTANNHTHA